MIPMAIQASAEPALIPAPAPQGVFYIPVVHSVDGKDYFPELRTGDTTKATLVADIASAQHEDISRVIAVDLSLGRAWDASREIAAEVLGVFIEERGSVPRWSRDFLTKHLGHAQVNYAEAWAA
jgi:hypothetical protein